MALASGFSGISSRSWGAEACRDTAARVRRPTSESPRAQVRAGASNDWPVRRGVDSFVTPYPPVELRNWRRARVAVSWAKKRAPTPTTVNAWRRMRDSRSLSESVAQSVEMHCDVTAAELERGYYRTNRRAWCKHSIRHRFGTRGVKIGRDDRIRTCDPLTPSQVRYQAALHPENVACSPRTQRPRSPRIVAHRSGRAVQPPGHVAANHQQPRHRSVSASRV